MGSKSNATVTFVSYPYCLEPQVVLCRAVVHLHFDCDPSREDKSVIFLLKYQSHDIQN